MHSLSELRDKPAGTIRIAASDHALKYVTWPKLKDVLPRYPAISVELVLDNGLTDIVTKRYDAGVRMGGYLAEDMISARIGPDFCLAVVGSPAYFAKHHMPAHPKELTSHACINFRLQGSDTLYAWEFEEEGHETRCHSACKFDPLAGGIGVQN